jgi:hypothetical protein
MLFKETVAVYCENHTVALNILHANNSEFYYVDACGKYRNHQP